ncbi:MAG: hypothetical protein IT556_04405 [Acetobacteraceae bacterium]|nr:hypothetical protein [Acetobacteraceae bacterium]
MTRLRWQRGRTEDGSGDRALEWIGCDDAGEAIARVVLLQGPMWTGWRLYRAVALDDEARVVRLLPSTPPEGENWLAVIGTQVVGRATLPLTAVRRAEAALTG